MSEYLKDRRRALTFGLALLAVVLAAVILALVTRPPGELLSSGSGAPGVGGHLPAGCVVGNVTAETAVEPPFAVAASAASPSGYALVLAEGRGDKAHNSGRAQIPLSVASGGRFRLWLRCRWSDSCGNSIGVTLADRGPTTVGQDALYGQWHWVDAGEAELPAGPLTVTLHEREDGVAVDQALLCPADSAFVPGGPILEGGRHTAGTRRFADSFDRSPGHGSDDWRIETGTWEIAFSLDPNRVPLQYALNAVPPAGEWGRALLRGHPWRGAVVRVSVYCEQAAAAVGVLFQSDRGPVAVVVGAAATVPDLPGVRVLRAPDLSLAPGQWYRLEAERWGWSARLAVDGAEVCRVDGLPAAEAGSLGLLVAGAPAVFDDVGIEEIPWLAEDGMDFRIAWEPDPEARWYRPRRAGTNWALCGRRGSLRAALGDGSATEVLLEGLGPGAAAGVHIPGWQASPATGVPGLVLLPEAQRPNELELVAEQACRLRRVVVRQQVSDPDGEAYHLGVYHFTEASVPDIADYLDFTPEEYQALAASPEAERWRRSAKEFPVVGSTTDYAIWGAESGRWAVHDGLLQGAGPGAVVRFWQALNGPFQVRLRVRLRAAESAARLVFAETDGRGLALRLAGPAAGSADDAFCTTVSPEEWHVLEADLSEHTLSWQVDAGEGQREPVHRGTGGGFLLTVDQGHAEFDDVLFAVPRQADLPQARCRFYAFDRRETDWWRRGNWTDHGGIACAVASSWISLQSPQGEGWLVHKQAFAGDLLVASNVEESTVWHGWDREPSHEHRPADNIGIVLATDQSLTQGYRLELNSRDRRWTVLSRNGTDVATVPQDASFPIQYVGGHAPYRPRRNRVCLVRQGDHLRAIVNGVQVLSYRDPEPLATPVLAIGGQHTHFNLSNLLVRELPPEADAP